MVLQASTERPFSFLAGGITMLSYPAVNCYVIITGFFSWNKKNTAKKLFISLARIWFSLFFFSVFGYIVCTIINGYSFSGIEMLKRCFPLSRSEWWFYTNYIILILLSPFINMVLMHFELKQIKILLIISIVSFSIIPMINNWEETIGVDQGYSIIWFITCYSLGGYINRYIKEKDRQPNSALFFIVYIIWSAAIYVVEYIFSRAGHPVYLSPYNGVFTLVQSICLFLCFVDLRIKNDRLTKTVGVIASYSLAAYLLHCQEDIWKFLWEKASPTRFANSINIIYVYIIVVSFIMAGGILIEYIRRKIFGVAEGKVINLLAGKLFYSSP